MGVAWHRGRYLVLDDAQLAEEHHQHQLHEQPHEHGSLRNEDLDRGDVIACGGCTAKQTSKHVLDWAM